MFRTISSKFDQKIKPMKNRFLNAMLVAFIMAFGISQLTAQDAKATTKVVVVEKTIDKDGNVEVKKEIKEGKDAEQYLKEVDIDVDIEEGKDTKVKSSQRYRIVTVDEEGNEQVMEWEGEGDMPADMKGLLETESFEIEVDEDMERKVIVKIIDDEDHEEVIVKEMDFDIDEDIDLEEVENIHVIRKRAPERKAQLGVRIKNADSGVEIIEVIPNSAAEKHGLRVGDIIKSIDGQTTGDVEELVNIVAGSQPDSKVKIRYERGGQEVVAKVKLQKPGLWPEAEEKHEEIIIIKKKD